MPETPATPATPTGLDAPQFDTSPVLDSPDSSGPDATPPVLKRSLTMPLEPLNDAAPAPKRVKAVAFVDASVVDAFLAVGEKAEQDKADAKTKSGNDKLVSRLVMLLHAGRVNAAALLHLFDEVEALAHVPHPPVTTARGLAVQQYCMQDMLLLGAQKAHAKTKEAWERTVWEKHGMNNWEHLNGHDEADAPVDGCGVCGVPKKECLDPSAHFGKRGESPPDSTCSQCSKDNYGNKYNTARRLTLHVESRGARVVRCSVF
jgi:hypothetical protein